MLRGIIRFHQGVLLLPGPVKIWMLLLMVMNGLIPLFFLSHLEAQVTLAAMLAGAMLMMGLTGKFGFTRMLGLGHIFWVPLVTWLGLRLGEIPINDYFGTWIRAVLAVNLLSLAFDTIDVFRYLHGERDEIVTFPSDAPVEEYSTSQSGG